MLAALLLGANAASAVEIPTSSCAISNRVLTRARNVASTTNKSNDGYKFLKRVWNPILADHGHPALPGDRGDGTWNHFWGPGQLKPGDVLASADGATGNWHGGVYAGVIDGVPMVIDDGNGTGKVRMRPLKKEHLEFFFARTHDMLCLSPKERKTEKKLTKQTAKAEKTASVCALSSKVMAHAKVIGHRINATGGYRFDGFNDCYGFVRRSWNPLLDARGKADLPVDDYPSSDWARIDWNKLVPGDVLSTAQGHHFGADWHGGIFAGMHHGVPYIFDDSGKHSRNGAYIRPLPYPGYFSFFYKPTHRMLEQGQACVKDEFLVRKPNGSFIAR